MTRTRILCLILLTVALLPCFLHAQQRGSALSDGEVEKLRETAADFPKRILAFTDFLNQRATRLEKLSTGRRAPGREEDLHDLIEQFTSILDDLEDNLEDYGQRHRDIRTALPKLVAATERWNTTLLTPENKEAYSVSRKLALESLHDVHDSAVKMTVEQKEWFLAHPPDKQPFRDPG